MSFDQLFQEIVKAAATGSGNTFVYAPVTVNLGIPGTDMDGLPQMPPAVVDRMLRKLIGGNLPGVAPKGHDWEGAEKESEAQPAKDDKHPEASDSDDSGLVTGAAAEEIKAEVAKTNFNGTVGEQTLIKKAVDLGFPPETGTALWILLDKSKELRNLCSDHDVPFPPLGTNNMFRRQDLRRLAKLEGINSVPKFGVRTRVYRTLRAL